MPAPPSIDEFDDDLLHELYDDGAVARGYAYAAEDRVRIVESRTGALRAVCRGSGRATYLVRLRWHSVGDGVYLDDECGCPIGGQCKHCVATLVTARRQAGPPASQRPATIGKHSLWRPTPASPPDWRSELAGLGGLPSPTPAAGGLALQFGLRASQMRSSGDDELRVAVRPLREGRSGRWIKGGATWRDLSSPFAPRYPSGPAVEPQQRNAVSALAVAAKIGPYSTGPDPTLDRFGPELWDLLRRAVESGVVLVGDPPSLVVELESRSADVLVDLSARNDGGVALTAQLMVDGTPFEHIADEVRTIGSPPHGAWAAGGSVLRLIGFDAPLHRVLASLLARPRLVIPAHDVDELIDDYVPALAQHARVVSSDESVALEESRFERLVLTVVRVAPDVADLRWSARYQRGARTTHHPLLDPRLGGRDTTAEEEALSELQLPLDVAPGLADHDGRPWDQTVAGTDALRLLTEAVPWLEARDQIDVEVLGGLPPLREATEAPVISVAVRDAAPNRNGNDWFDLAITVTVDGEDVDFVSLFTALHRGDAAMVLPSGTWLPLDRPEFSKLRALLDEARGLADPPAAADARVNRFQMGWWDELLALGVVAQQTERWTRTLGLLSELAAPDHVAVPAGLQADLRPYQHDGLDWLAFLHRAGLGGILADDMGLGKTVQTLALCLHVHAQQPDARFLVVAPTSVVDNWEREARRFAPELDVRTIHETGARRGTTLAIEVAGAHLVVTSYALFRLEFDQYAALDWELLLVDEAQFVKNHQSKTHQFVRRLDAPTKIAITGTPLENTLMDLWALLSITAPGLYPDPKRFADTYRKPIESGTAPELLTTLKQRIAPLMRRRTKDAVLTELPPKIEQTIEVELSSKHARTYATQLQRQRQKVLGLVGDVTKHRFEILRSLTILRQMALDPALVDTEHEHIGSAKLDRLVDDLTQVVAEGHRALVFSQFTRFLARARTRLDTAGIEHAYLDGRTRNRERAIARFKDGDVPVFVISLKAGGVGLNLTEADYCFVLDPWWNPATETQAVDRAHRIGQRNPVVVYRYVSTGTIEEKVMELKARKARLFDQVVGDEEALAGALTEADVRALLGLS